MRDVFYNTSVEIFEAKKKALKERDESQIAQGKDILSILSAYLLLLLFERSSLNACTVRSNMSLAEEDRMSREELMGQIK